MAAGRRVTTNLATWRLRGQPDEQGDGTAVDAEFSDLETAGATGQQTQLGAAPGRI